MEGKRRLQNRIHRISGKRPGQPNRFDDYLGKECSSEGVFGPLRQELFPQVHRNRFAVFIVEDNCRHVFSSGDLSDNGLDGSL